MAEVPLAAYSNRLSGRPGDTLRFHVSSIHDGSITAKLTRCICADPNPAGPGCIEVDASTWFRARTFAGRRQTFQRGSFGRSKDAIYVDEGSDSALIQVWVCPTHVPGEVGEKDTMLSNTSNQCIWSWGDLKLQMKPNGKLDLCHIEEVLIDSNETWLMSNNWYCIKAHIHQLATNKCCCKLIILDHDKLSHKETVIFQGDQIAEAEQIIPQRACFELASGGTFNGRLEQPKITIGDKSGIDPHNIHWDTSCNMTEWSIPSNDNSNPLVLYNHPTRGVRGHLWDGMEFCWKHNSSHYGAIHFHDDDVYDFNWECDFELEIPNDMPSGIYIMRLKNENCDEEALPLFICPKLKHDVMGCGAEKKKLCVLMSTFTYGENLFAEDESSFTSVLSLVYHFICSHVWKSRQSRFSTELDRQNKRMERLPLQPQSIHALRMLNLQSSHRQYRYLFRITSQTTIQSTTKIFDLWQFNMLWAASFSCRYTSHCMAASSKH